MKRARSDGTDGARIVLFVTGMTCGHCERKVAGALEAIPYVDRARADARGGRAEAWLRAGTEDGPGIRASLASAVAAAGYEAVPGGAGRRDGLIAAAVGTGLAGLFALAESAGLFSFVPVPDGGSAPGML
ncbi:MAG TPA: cation transporter, partial [Spirochaetia bacterium]|nr:cation transporter [Spirochaetia bacterium]